MLLQSTNKFPLTVIIERDCAHHISATEESGLTLGEVLCFLLTHALLLILNPLTVTWWHHSMGNGEPIIDIL
uniref:Uncharacterized protein n=1 Tax=Arundo donax TaxID=35708 RepID=A0A0A9F3P8_ARUDO